MSRKERKLSAAERKRKAEYDRLCEQMERDGYRKMDLTIDIVAANVGAFFVMLPFVILVGWLCLRAGLAWQDMGPYSGVLLFAGLLILLVVHEGIHGLVWGACAKNHFRSIAFGVIWQALAPYCTCSEPLKRWQYILGAAAPTLVVGFGLAAVATAVGQVWLFILAELMIFGGGGDALIILKTLAYKPKSGDALYYDHPYECGLVVFEK